MVEAQVKFAVVGHHSRHKQALCLAESLGAVLLIDNGDNGANWNHRRALEWAAGQDCRVVIVEDDALPVVGFPVLAAEWLTRFPDSLVSLLPRYRSSTAISIADSRAANYR